MFCSACGQENRGGAHFCTKCGVNLQDSGEETLSSAQTDGTKVSKAVLSPKTLRIVASAAVVAVLGYGTYVGSQRYADYSAAQAQIGKASSLAAEGKFAEARNALNALETNGVWIAPWIRDSYETQKQQLEIDVAGEEAYAEAVRLQEEGKLEEARSALEGINVQYSRHSDVQVRLSEVRGAIEEKLRAEAEEQKKAAETAQADAKTAQAKADAAAASARQAQQAKAAAEAAASAAASTAARERAAAEERAVDAAATEKATAFIDETVTIYNTLNRGVAYFNEGIEYGLDDVDRMISRLTSASTIFQEVKQRSADLYEYRTPSGYESVSSMLYTAADEYESSIQYYMNAAAETVNPYGSMTKASRLVDEAIEAYRSASANQTAVGKWLVSVGR